MGQSSNAEYAGQQDRILDLLKSRGYGQWVSLPEIEALKPHIADRNTRIWELRHKRDFNIQCDVKTVDGEKHSRYRLLPGSWHELRGKPEPGYSPRALPAKIAPLKTWEQVVKERDEKMRQPEPEFELTP